MTKKKNTQIPVSPEENAQAQQIFEHYQQLSASVRASRERAQVEAALAEINALPEGAQMTLLGLLSKEKQVDAADLLTALYEFAALKETRKEARRALIRLEGAKIYSAWEAPLEPVPGINTLQLSTNPPRFWKGFVTDSRDIGEVQMLLCWQQGEDYKEVRVLGFLLEFWHDGVKDCFANLESKRSFENFLNQIRTTMPDVKLKDCSLAHGRHLLNEALAVNSKAGTKPGREYQLHHSLVKQLILDAPDLEEEEELAEEVEFEEEEEEIDLSGLEPKEVVGNFVEYWIEENYGTAYDLLAQDSPLREGLSREAWIERRAAWADEFYLDDFEPMILHELEAPQSKLWLPNPFSKPAATTREVEAGWSVESEKLPLAETLPEIPKAIAVYQKTGRHWFWASFTLVQDNGEWRIQNMTDEGVKAQNLSKEELQARLTELNSKLTQLMRQHSDEEIENINPVEPPAYISDVVGLLAKISYYTDVLVKKAPLERDMYEEAISLMMMMGQYERCLVYLELLLEHFPDERALTYRRMADVQLLQSESCELIEEEDDAEFYEELAEESLEASLALEDNFDAHIALARLFIDQEDRLDEAEEQLRQARKLIVEPDNEAEVEYGLALIAEEREQFQQALKHYQRITEIDPEDADAWSDLGDTHKELNNVEEAEAGYKRAIELEPDNPTHYSSLGLLYRDTDQPARAFQALEDGLIANPDSMLAHMYLVAAHISNNDFEQAELFLDKAEQLDPEEEMIQEYRQEIILRKAMQLAPDHQPAKFPGPKKKRKR